MAEIKILQSVVIPLTLGGNTIASDVAMSSEERALVADDTTAHEDEIRIDLAFTGGDLGGAVNVYLAEGNTASEFDGDVPASSTAVLPGSLPNLGVPAPILSQDNTGENSRGSAVFRITKSKFIVVVENKSPTASITVTGLTATPLNYETL